MMAFLMAMLMFSPLSQQLHAVKIQKARCQFQLNQTLRRSASRFRVTTQRQKTTKSHLLLPARRCGVLLSSDKDEHQPPCCLPATHAEKF